MKQRVIKNRKDRTSAIEAIMRIDYPYVISVGREKQRSESQNSRYWAHVEEWLEEIAKYVDMASDKTGYTPLEVRGIIAHELGWPKNIIIGTLKKQAAHEAMKMICAIPTSTKLGTKEFQRYEGIMDMTFSDILGTVRKITGKMT